MEKAPALQALGQRFFFPLVRAGVDTGNSWDVVWVLNESNPFNETGNL